VNPGSSKSEAARREIADLAEGIREGRRAAIGRGLSLIESTLAERRPQAEALLSMLAPHAGSSHRIGVTGIPGVGKSTLIEGLGLELIAKGHRVAVLAIDPSSTVSGGSILGDKTRMSDLGRSEQAFIRPSPSQGLLGGISQWTRDSILVCEAAGFDRILIETVGVGQSESSVAEVVDTVLLVMIAGAGDELQGIKRGLLEVAHVIAFNKADGKGRDAALAARQELEAVLRFTVGAESAWSTPVLTCSALQRETLSPLLSALDEHREVTRSSGEFAEKRHAQTWAHTWALVNARVLDRVHRDPKLKRWCEELEAKVRTGSITASVAARSILKEIGIDP